MITLKNASYRHGYTRMDHLIDDGPLQDLVGRQFRSVGEIRRALCARDKFADRRVRSAPHWIEVLFADGSTREF